MKDERRTNFFFFLFPRTAQGRKAMSSSSSSSSFGPADAARLAASAQVVVFPDGRLFQKIPLATGGHIFKPLEHGAPIHPVPSQLQQSPPTFSSPLLHAPSPSISASSQPQSLPRAPQTAFAQIQFENEIIFFVNGSKTVVREPDPTLTLNEFLRSKYGLQGTKKSCAEVCIPSFHRRSSQIKVKDQSRKKKERKEREC